MPGLNRLLKTCLATATIAALGVAACSGADDHTAVPGDAGAAGQNNEAGASSSGGDPGSGGSSNAAAGTPSGGAGSGGDDGGASGGATGGVASEAEPGGAGAGGQAECRPGAAAGGEGGAGASGVSEVLYSNDFETPNMVLSASCGNSLDLSGINALYGTADFVFQQVNTVEGVVIHDPHNLYADPSGIGKNYALGMLSAYQNDLLALTFDVTGHAFLNVGFDLSAIDVSGCGGPFGTDVPIMQVSLYDTPTGSFSFGAPGTLLAQGTVTGAAAVDRWTFGWSYGVVSLDASAATGSSLTIVFDLLQSGYGAFDNLSIVAAGKAGIVDKNNDGIPDDQQCLP